MKKHWSLFFLIGLGCGMFFQNCTGAGFAAKPATVTTVDLPYGHPSIDITSGPVMSGQIVLGDQLFISSVYRDVFDSPSASAAAKTFLQNVLYTELNKVQQSLGRSCDPLSDGNLRNCQYMISNADTAMNAASSAIREASRIQTCRRLLASNEVLSNVVAKIGQIQTPPAADTISAAIGLFYPANPIVQGAQTDLANLDQSMANGKETASDRWRILLLTLCESPTWEVL